ncbi:amylo-alpha-1,6-glucosidase [Deinococcus sp. 23YEL01]|uniref:amylo-alpha-1,6-glucosidase n=2 Tax=unclassified Deinococcus TaxID=2623546 RepID=UPI001E487CA8|nr:amylo-alpha-1,6-glucosidase [Deinococcus sp. 23YEL01]MCD0168791.1 glycogen debranching enzyme family protein [Deinococcus sp. 23YEL01]
MSGSSTSGPARPAAPGPVSAYTYGPLAARDPDLEVLLTDGLGGFALSSVAGVPTRCYSGLVVSEQPPVRRRTLFVSPLETLHVAGREAKLHALEIAPDVFEGRGLELLTGAAVWDLLPEREQLFAGVRVRRRVFMPPASGAAVFLYDVQSREPVTLRLGGLFVNRDMHHVHARVPELHFGAGGREVTVRGPEDSGGGSGDGRAEGGPVTRATLHAPGAVIDALTPQPHPQRVYYRHDAARGEPDHEVTLGSDLWEISFPAGGGRAALVVQGMTPATAGHTVTDPWSAYAQEAARRSELARRAQDTSGVRDELVATLAVAADAYLVRRERPAGVTVIAGYPWFADWGRDSMIALTGLTLLTGRHAEARDLLGTFLASLRRGLTPNNFHDDGGGAGFNTVDGALWLAVALERYVSVTGDLSFARSSLPALRELLDWHLRGTDHGIRADDRDGLLLAGEAGVQLTWMDVKIEGWVVTPRHGKPVEVQGLWLAALGAEARLSDALGERPQYVGALARARESFPAFWQGSAYADALAADGTPDRSVRPNVALALALPDTPTTPAQVDRVIREVESQLLTPVGVHTLSPLDARYRGNYGGAQVQRDAAYHQGTVWPWPLTAFVELLLSRGEVRRARAALAGLTGHVWEAGIGHVSEVFAGDSLRPGGCPFQAWSTAELLRAHVLVSLAEARAARPAPATVPAGPLSLSTQNLT